MAIGVYVHNTGLHMLTVKRLVNFYDPILLQVSPTGGRITVVQATLPNIGPGSLKAREGAQVTAVVAVSTSGSRIRGGGAGWQLLSS